ncbi:MAG: DUF4391 domain-containing protein [Bacteroidaceae bacterium]|nr:DUF4391 domain-containing protein [Bacteroidaceae bacterium]
MFGLPASTVVNQPLPKKAFFEKFNLKVAERNRFDADISRMVIVARISQATVPTLAAGKDIPGFYFVHVILKQKEYSDQCLLLLNKLVGQKMIFALQYGEETQFAVFHTRLLKSEWQKTEFVSLDLKGLTLDDAWQNFIFSIGGLDAQAEETIEEQIINREQREKLLRQIEILEKQCRTEKQTRKKYDLHQKIVELKNHLSV